LIPASAGYPNSVLGKTCISFTCPHKGILQIHAEVVVEEQQIVGANEKN